MKEKHANYINTKCLLRLNRGFIDIKFVGQKASSGPSVCGKCQQGKAVAESVTLVVQILSWKLLFNVQKYFRYY